MQAVEAALASIEHELFKKAIMRMGDKPIWAHSINLNGVSQLDIALGIGVGRSPDFGTAYGSRIER